MEQSDKLKILKYAVDYKKGALWWGEESYIKAHFTKWTVNNRLGHPLLSLREKEITNLADSVMMLVGTSTPHNKKHSIKVEVTSQKITYFSFRMISKLIFAEDFIYHAQTPEVENDPETPVWERRHLWPNLTKPRLNDQEMKQLDKFIRDKKIFAFDNKGYCK